MLDMLTTYEYDYVLRLLVFLTRDIYYRYQVLIGSQNQMRFAKPMSFREFCAGPWREAPAYILETPLFWVF